MKSLYIKGSAKSLKKLEQLQKTGELSKILGHEVVEVKQSSAEQIKSLQQQGVIIPVKNPETIAKKSLWDTIISFDYLPQAMMVSIFIAVLLILPINLFLPVTKDNTQEPKYSSPVPPSPYKYVFSIKEAEDFYTAFQNSQIHISKPEKTSESFKFSIQYRSSQRAEIIKLFNQYKIKYTTSSFKQLNIEIELYYE